MAEEPSGGGLGPLGDDRLLGGRLLLRQPLKGHRAGTDAVLLAAALPALGAGPLVDLGAGVGTVGLAAALLQPALRVALLERDPELAALARHNATANGLTERVMVVAGDVAGPADALNSAGLGPASFACVAMNPPFYGQGDGRASPVANRRAAHVADVPLEAWLTTARRLLAPGGALVLIHRAEAIAEVLAGLGRGFGAVDIRPVHARADRPAIRILVTATLNSKRPAALLPAFVLHGEDGAATPESDAVHRGTLRLGC